MNWDEIEGNWRAFNGKVRTRWGKLTDDDLEAAKGKRDELIGLLQKHYGQAREATAHQLDEWARALK